jgi:hypothetical protein
MRIRSLVGVTLCSVVAASLVEAQAGRRPAPRPGSAPARPAVAAPAAAAPSETPGIELGFDGAYIRDQDAESNTIAIPVNQARIGFFISPTLSIEPAVSLTYQSAGGDNTRSVNADIAALWHFTGTRNTTQLFLRPVVGLSNSGGSDQDSETDFAAGGGLGVKIPMSDRVLFRGEGFYRRLFTDPGRNLFGATFGLSIYSR